MAWTSDQLADLLATPVTVRRGLPEQGTAPLGWWLDRLGYSLDRETGGQYRDPAPTPATPTVTPPAYGPVDGWVIPGGAVAYVGPDLEAQHAAMQAGQLLALPDGDVRLSTSALVGADFPATSRLDQALSRGRRGLVGRGAKSRIVAAPTAWRRPKQTAAAYPQGPRAKLIELVEAGPTIVANLALVGTGSLGGYAYHGLRVANAVGGLIDRVYVTGWSGFDKQPPGETGGLCAYKTTDLVVRRSEFDAAGVGSSPIMLNRDVRPLVEDVYCHDVAPLGAEKHGAGMPTWWACESGTIVRLKVRRCRTGLNFEECTGTWIVDDPDIAECGQWAASIVTHGASAKWTFRIDPSKYRDGFSVRLQPWADMAANGQRAADVTIADLGDKILPARSIPGGIRVL